MPETNLQPHFRNYNPREPFPNFQKPHIIDGFSLEQDRTLSEQPRKYLQFWRRPKPGTFDFDLKLGYESYVPGPKETNINSLLKYYQRAGKRNASLFKDSRLAGDFVCYRGLLTQICITPYSTRDPWSVVAIKFRGTIYLCNYESPEKKKAKEASESEYSRKCAFYGKNFERFVMTGDQSVRTIPLPTGPLNDTEEFSVTLSTKLEGFRIIYAAEMDGVDDLSHGPEVVNSETDLNRVKFVEVKTRMKDSNERQYSNYVKWKLPKWWMQSFLSGVETIFVGFRTKDGHISEMEELPVKEIPRMAKGMWSPAIMIRFGADFLATVSELMRDVDCPRAVFKFDYDSSRSWNVTYDVYEGKNEFSFLPESFIDFMAKSV